MPAALTTTKRKFHKILDSISNASSVSLISDNQNPNASTTTLPTIVDPPAKRPRVMRPSSTSNTQIGRVITTSGAATRSLSVIQQHASARTSEGHKPPNFAPWDRAQFLERLKTYRHVDRWRGKPEKINEVQWSKRGWSCVGKERVGCVGGCGKEVVIMLESNREEKENADAESPDQGHDDEEENDWREKAQEQLVEKYAEMVTTSHDEGCLWRRRGCDDTIQRLPLAHQGTAIENLRKRYLSLDVMASELPSNLSTPQSFNVSDIHEQLLSLLRSSSAKPQMEATSSDRFSESEAPLSFNSSAMSLAIFGWQAEEGHISGLATCTACFRRLGLWLFKPSSDSSNPSSMDRLDVVGEHRDYCPWVNALSQNGAISRRTSLDGLEGWQVLLRAIRAIAVHEKYDVEKEPPAVSKEPSEVAVSEADSVLSSTTMKEDRKDQDEKDRERWTKLKRLKQVFHVKRGKGREINRQRTNGKVG